MADKEHLNKDGLVPGEEVDFATIMRLSKKHKKLTEDQPKKKTNKPENTKPGKF